MNYLIWVLYFIPNLLIYAACMILNPLAALFPVRLGSREYLVKPLYWFQTHDNPVDEYWFGGYWRDSFFPLVKNATPEQYDSSRFFRYVCRLFWLWRNCAYGFSYNLFGRTLDATISEKVVGNEKSGYWYRFTRRKSSFQYKAHIPFCPWAHLDLNFGWKTHSGFPKAMYAGRLISFRLTE